MIGAKALLWCAVDMIHQNGYSFLLQIRDTKNDKRNAKRLYK